MTLVYKPKNINISDVHYETSLLRARKMHWQAIPALKIYHIITEFLRLIDQWACRFLPKYSIFSFKHLNIYM